MILSNSILTVLFGLLALGLLLFVLVLLRQVKKQGSRLHLDPLTGALNSTGFTSAAEKNLTEPACQYALVAMQLRNYSQILETFGPDNTNRVLQHLYKSLKGCLSNTEPAGRVFGGTFFFLLKNRQEEAIRVRLERIVHSANLFNRGNPIPYTLDLTFGICIPGTPAQPLSQMQENALLLARCREDSPFRFYQADPDDQAELNWELIRKVDSSLRNGDFIVYLQPKVRMADTRVVGAEALIRWRHPKKGLLTPEMFVPLLEEYRQVTTLDLYLFEQVCRNLASWKNQGWKPCPISMNLSAETLLTRNRVPELENICRKYQVDPKWIELELDESFLRAQPQKLTDLVKQLHERGFRCSLDNFGKTIIPMHMLRQLDVDAVKLDRSFFAGENNSRRNRFLVGSILKFTSQMQIAAVAEGIDNPSQAQYLLQAGCDYAQGVYYRKPMSVEEFCSTVYDQGDLCYLEENNERTLARQSSGSKIVMFSLTMGENLLVLSEPFSPVLEGKLKLTNALDLFRYSSIIHENDRTDFFHLLERCCKEDGWVENTLRFYTAEGRYEWMEVHLHKEHGLVDKDIVISGTLVNKAGWSSEVNRWKDKANRDALTGLYNKEHFELSANAILEKPNAAGAIIFVDIDDFKKVNDTLGHSVGDDVIRCVAKRIFGVFRHTDIVARYGGDEFVVFVNGIAKEDLVKRLKQLRDGFQFPYRNETVEYPVSGSIGAALFPEAGTHYREILDHADYALYTAKRQGKNQFVLYQPGMDAADAQ